MANAVESELVKATGLKKKSGETFQAWAERLITATSELAEEDWDALDAATQDWVNDGSRAMNKDKDIARFPEDDAGEEAPAEEADDKPRGRGRAAKDEEEEPPAEEERPRGRRSRDPEPEPEEEAPRGGRRSREPEPEDDPPARGRRGRAAEEEADDKPRGRGRATKDEEPAEEAPRGGRRGRAAKEEEEPAPKRGGGRTRASAKDEDPPKGKPAKRGAAEGKSESSTTLLKKMLIKKPSMTTEDILEELDNKHGLQPTRMAIASIRSAFLHSCRILDEAGLLDEKFAAKL